MDAFEMIDTPKPRRRRRRSPLVWNVLTGLVLLICSCVGIVYLMIFMNPYGALNPFPPPTQLELPFLVTPTPTKTLRVQLRPTWTPTPSQEPTATFTPRPSATPLITDTPASLQTDIPTSAPQTGGGSFAFIVQQGSPQAIANIYHAEAGCNWMGVAGQVTTLNGSPVTGLLVQLSGTLAGQIFETRLSLTGVVKEYGPSGYEIQISDTPIESNQTLFVQLIDQSTNLPLSDKIYFNTYNDCQKNLILLNFIKRN